MKKTILAVLAASALGVSASAHAFDVDLFVDDQVAEDQTEADGAVFNSVTESVVGNIMGTERDISVDMLDGQVNIGGVPQTSVKMIVTGGVLSFSNDDGVKGEGVVQWDGADNSPILDVDGLGGLDLRQYGDGFTVETITADLGFPIAINAYTDATHFTLVEISTTGPGQEFISFDALENALLCGTSGGAIISVTCGAGGNVDMSNFGALEFIININGATASVDLSIGPIAVVPTPATLSLLGLGLMSAGLAGVRRRKGKSAV